MKDMSPRVDTHVHFYTQKDLARVAGALPYSMPKPHPLTTYLDDLIDAGIKPTLVNNVHLSILPDSGNVFASFEELALLRQRDPARYDGIRLVGTLLAEPAYATEERLSHPSIQGIRIVLHDATVEAVPPDRYSSSAWRDLFARLAPHQHVHIYAQRPEVNLLALQQVPAGVSVLIDHLGTCHAGRGVDDPAFAHLLECARARGNVFFKGPGYRTSIDPDVAAAFATRIVDTLGPERLLLEATDAPHVGGDSTGRSFADAFDALSAYSFVDRLAEKVSLSTGVMPSALRREACAGLFPFPS